MPERQNSSSPQDRSEVQKETAEEFKKRVEERTGIKYDDIPRGVPEDLQGGEILCKRGEVYVVTFGYPDEEDSKTGEKTYTNFRVVDLSGI